MTIAEEDYVDVQPLALAIGVIVTPTLDTASVVGAFASPQYGWFQYSDGINTFSTTIQQAIYDAGSGFYLTNWTLYALGQAVAVSYTGTLYEMGATPAAYPVTWTQPLLAPLDQVTLPRPSSLTTLATIKDICARAANTGWLNGTQYGELRTMINRLNRTRTIQ